MKRKICAALLALLMLASACAEHTRDGIRMAYRNIADWAGARPTSKRPR